jgi:hypothetical protein
MSLAPKHRWGLAFGGVLLALLLAAPSNQATGAPL